MKRASSILEVILLAICFWLPGGAIEAQDEAGAKTKLPKDLSELKLSYEVLLSKIQKPSKDLQSNYLKRLKTIETAQQEKGNLPALLAVRAEMASLAESGDPVAEDARQNEPPELSSARTIFVREKTRLQEIASRKAAPLTNSYRTKLEGFKANYTRAGNLKDALAAKTLLEATPVIEAPLPKPTRIAGKRELKMNIQVDGGSHLFIRGSKIWYDHTKGWAAAPGRHQGSFPTYLDDETEWMPNWIGSVTEHYDAGIELPEGDPPVKVNVRNGKGRGYAEVIEQPSKENNYTAKIELKDEDKGGKRYFGSDWMEIRLSW